VNQFEYLRALATFIDKSEVKVINMSFSFLKNDEDEEELVDNMFREAQR
jgi:hypothetical protein